MNKNCVFTIVAKNYIGLAQILEKSINKYFDQFDFYIVIADEINSELLNKIPTNIIIAKDELPISEQNWTDMSFKYNLTEFCTSIKPASFRYFFDKFKYEKCIYLDPDIYFFSSIAPVFEMLNDCQILLTPHITQISDEVISDAPESAWNSCGIFNLGFLGLKRGDASFKAISWWNNRLLTQCYIDSYNSLFTDQKWIDFLPSFFTDRELKITRHLGMNLAPWNYFEREVYFSNKELYVKSRNSVNDAVFPLIFVHYSGYDYSALKSGRVIQNNIPHLKDYSDIQIITSIYAEAIFDQVDLFDQFIDLQYTYNTFENGVSIQLVHRRLYRSLIAQSEIFENPFSVDFDSFYTILSRKNMISKSAVNLDKATKINLKNVGLKLKLFNVASRISYKLLGFQKYMLLIKLLRSFARYESQIHLLNNKYDKKNIF